MSTITPLPEDLAALGVDGCRAALKERKERGRELAAKGKSDKNSITLAEMNELRAINEDAERLDMWLNEPDPASPLRHTAGNGNGGGFHAAVAKAGWDQNTKHRVVVPNGPVLQAAVTWTGSVGDISPRRHDPSQKGADQRYIYPVLRREGLDALDTSVDYLKQTVRALPDPALMIRAIDATSEKPEMAITVELSQAIPKQVAHKISGVPNIIAKQPAFRQLVDFDLRLGLSEALDKMTIDQVAAATIPAGAAGATFAAGVRKAITAVRAAGYEPDTIALDPTADEDLDLYLLTLNNTTGMDPLFRLQRRIGKSVADPFVFDSKAFATLYAGPVEFASFEENDGETNSMLLRAELNAIVIVDRDDAAASVTVTP